VRVLIRLAALGIVGAVLHFIGSIDGALIEKPNPAAAVLCVVALGLALAVLVAITSGTGRGDGASDHQVDRRVVRGLWIAVSVLAFFGVAGFFALLAHSPADGTPYHNDAIAINECAAQMVLAGKDPYSSLDLFACYDRLGIGPDRTTPLQRGAFATVAVYPTDAELQVAWEERKADPASNIEFEWRPSYPALSFLLLVPWVTAGLDPNHLSALLLVLGAVLVLARAERTARGLLATALFACVVIIAWTIGGSSDLVYAVPLLVAWLWRERRSSVLWLGIACATKQLAWFAAPYYFMQVARTHGWREASLRAGLALGIFLAANAPFILTDPAAWFAGVTTPIRDPMFPRGSGLVFLSTGGALPLAPAIAYAALEFVAAVACLIVAWRLRRSSPELGLVLAFVPLFFAWRSLFSYFFLLPLFAAGSIARMPLGVPEAEAVRSAGGVALVEGPRRPARAA